MADPRQVLEEKEEVRIKEELSYPEYPIRILDKKEQVLRRRVIPYVKVQWSNHTPEEAMWELEERMRQNFPQIFDVEE